MIHQQFMECCAIDGSTHPHPHRHRHRPREERDNEMYNFQLDEPIFFGSRSNHKKNKIEKIRNSIF